MITKRVYVGEFNGNRSAGRPRKRWLDTVKECLKKRGLDVPQDRSVYEGECMGHSPGDEPLTLTRCYSCGMPKLHEAFEGWNSVCGRAYNLRGIKGKIFCFSFFLKVCFSFTVAHFMG